MPSLASILATIKSSRCVRSAKARFERNSGEVKETRSLSNLRTSSPWRGSWGIKIVRSSRMLPDARETSSFVGTLLPYLKGLAKISVSFNQTKVKMAYIQDNSKFRERMPFTIPKEDANNAKSFGSRSQGSCAVGGGNSGTETLQDDGNWLYETPSPSNRRTFDSSIPSRNMIPNSSHPAFDQIALRYDSKSSV